MQTTRFKIGCAAEKLECVFVNMWVRNRVLPLVPGSGSCKAFANALSHLYDAIMPQLIRRGNHSLINLIGDETRAQHINSFRLEVFQESLQGRTR